MPDATVNPKPISDTGTGLYSPPQSPITYESPGNEPTGAVPGPPASVTYTSEDHEGEPTGVAAPPGPQTVYSWPDGPQEPDTKQVERADVEDKSVRRSKRR